MLFNCVVSTLLAAGAAFASPLGRNFKRDASFAYGSTVVRGASIGGWLVLEPWITPSIFQAQNGSIVDEWTLGQYLGEEAALAVLTEHWNTFTGLADFQKLADAGFNLVRIPIGYWAYQKFDDDTYVQGAAPYLDQAIGWANQTGLKVWVDLHGAPGSQNGFDNSGRRQDKPGWQQGDTVDQTLQVLQTIIDKYAQEEYNGLVVGIELVNEPFSPELDLDILRQYYRDGFGKVREVNQDMPVILQDGFNDDTYWDNFLTPDDDNAKNVVLDHHQYQVFNDTMVAWSNWQHRQEVCNMASSYQNADHWVVVGEWTAAQTDCAPALNGYGIGARYDGTYPNSTYVGSCAGLNDITTWSQQQKDDTRGYIEAQLETFERYTQGWIFWNFKTEAAAEWDLFRLLDAGVFPQPLTSRKFSSICS
ncbi:MAG: hypothetical protein M1819_000738 [Sarea resinae]|nr:MAG: hypothetical protein M1819_000738 [Sarea resinae]